MHLLHMNILVFITKNKFKGLLKLVPFSHPKKTTRPGCKLNDTETPLPAFKLWDTRNAACTATPGHFHFYVSVKGQRRRNRSKSLDLSPTQLPRLQNGNTDSI